VITLHFEKLSRYDRPGEPVAVAVPFAEGYLKDISNVAVLDGGRPVPTQVRQTAVWPDGSCKWLLVNFLADLPGNCGKDFTLATDIATPVFPEQPARVSLVGDSCRIDTGALSIELNPSELPGLWGAVRGTGFAFEAGELVGPVVTAEGKQYTASLYKSCWKIVESGPVRVIVEAKGKHRDENGDGLLDFELRISAFAGKPWLQVDYRMINREKTAEIHLDAIDFMLKPALTKGQIRTAVATSNYESFIDEGDGSQRLFKMIDGEYLLYDMNEHFPETFYGTFFADWNDSQRGGLSITQYQAYQNYPKSLAVDAAGIEVGILPRESDGLTFYQGMAKTHTLFFYFHSGDVSVADLNVQSLQFQLADRPVMDSEVYRSSGLFENIFVEKKLDYVERGFIGMADSRIRAYGILAWGDAPDVGYTQQGRGNGELVWTNNEYDFPHAMMLMYVKSGERRMMDYVLTAAQHQMDVDICHYHPDPLRQGGQVIHSARHVSGYVAPCHQWVEGLLDYYHLTGNEHALEAAFGIGENLIRLLQQPRYQGEGGINARETGWAMRALLALYKETYDERWLEPTAKIVDHFEIWKKQYGGWLAPYTDHVAIRVPFMIAIAVNSLMRYYRVRPEERVKRMILEAVDDLVENCVMENGLFYYKELPSLRRLGNNPLVLEALAYAYELTGNKRYLEIGLPTFQMNIRARGGGRGDKEIIGDAVVTWSGDGPKRFAQSFHTLAYYYRVAREAGVL